MGERRMAKGETPIAPLKGAGVSVPHPLHSVTSKADLNASGPSAARIARDVPLDVQPSRPSFSSHFVESEELIDFDAWADAYVRAIARVLASDNRRTA
jgi:hypothetical protein